jgi:hypothetical protein
MQRRFQRARLAPSIRPSSRSALAKWLCFADANSFFRIVDGTADRFVIDAARWSRSSQWPRIRVVLIGRDVVRQGGICIAFLERVERPIFEIAQLRCEPLGQLHAIER